MKVEDNSSQEVAYQEEEVGGVDVDEDEYRSHGSESQKSN